MVLAAAGYERVWAPGMEVVFQVVWMEANEQFPTMMLVVVVVLTLTRIIKSVLTGQAPVTLELRNTPA